MRQQRLLPARTVVVVVGLISEAQLRPAARFITAEFVFIIFFSPNFLFIPPLRGGRTHNGRWCSVCVRCVRICIIVVILVSGTRSGGDEPRPRAWPHTEEQRSIEMRRGIEDGMATGAEKADGRSTSRHEMLSMLPRPSASPINLLITCTTRHAHDTHTTNDTTRIARKHWVIAVASCRVVRVPLRVGREGARRARSRRPLDCRTRPRVHRRRAG